MPFQVQYTPWTRQQFKQVIRREVMDTNTNLNGDGRWFKDAELNQYLDNWLEDLQQDYEFVWAVNTFTIGSMTGSLVFNTSSFSPGMLRHEAVYYNGFRLAGRLLQDLEVLDPTWRTDLGIGTGPGPLNTNTQDTPRMSVMYPDYGNILIWPTPPIPYGTFSNVFIFEYPALLTFASDLAPSGLPVWTQWSAKSYVCERLFSRSGPLNDLRKAQRYAAMYARAKQRIQRMWVGFLPEKFLRLKPGNHYEWDILIPPPAWEAGTATQNNLQWSTITPQEWTDITPDQWSSIRP